MRALFGPSTFVQRVARKFGWGLGDQALSSLTNMVLGLLVVRALGTSGYGAFNIAFGAYLLALGVSRSLATDALVIRYSTVSADVWRTATRSATGTALAVGAAAVPLCSGAGFIIGGTVGDALIGLAIVLPGLLLQDSWRFAFFASRRGAYAFVNDLVWTLLLFPLVAFLILSDEESIFWMVVAWGGAATVAAIVGVWQARLLPDLRSLVAWWKSHKDLSGRFALEFLATNGATAGASFGIAALGSLSLLGTLRAASLLLGPINVVNMGVGLIAVPEGARAAARSTTALTRLSLYVSGAVALAALAWGGFLLLVPDSMGESLLGETWNSALAVMVPITIFTALGGAALGASTGLRAAAAARTSLKARLITSILVLVGAPLCAAIGRVPIETAWGLVVMEGIMTITWWYMYKREMSRRRDQADPPDAQPFDPDAASMNAPVESFP